MVPISCVTSLLVSVLQTRLYESSNGAHMSYMCRVTAFFSVHFQFTSFSTFYTDFGHFALDLGLK